MKFSRAQHSLFVLFIAVFLSQTSIAQDLDPSITGLPSDMTVGQVLQDAFDAADELVTEAFDRFDTSILVAATEVRAIVNQASLQLNDYTSLTLNQLDAQQKRTISDIILLTNTVSGTITDDISELAIPIQNNIQLLLSQNPGFVRLTTEVARAQDEFITLDLQGTALSRARVVNFRIGLIEKQPNVVSNDDTHLNIRITLEDLLSANSEESTSHLEELTEVPISFAFEECFWRRFFCRTNRSFSTIGYVLPNSIGTVRAVFVGDISSEERREITRGPFRSPRVQSDLIGFPHGNIDYDIRTDTWVATPEDGWRIDIESAHFNFALLRGGCSNRRSGASWVEQDEYILRVRAVTSSERRSGATCQSETTFNFAQWRHDTERYRYETDPEDINLDGVTVLRLEETSGLMNARLSHVRIESPLVKDGSRLLRAGYNQGGLRVEYDPAIQTVYLHSFER